MDLFVTICLAFHLLFSLHVDNLIRALLLLRLFFSGWDWERQGGREKETGNVFGSLMRRVLRITGTSEKNETGRVGCWSVNDGVHFIFYFRFRGS